MKLANQTLQKQARDQGGASALAARRCACGAPSGPSGVCEGCRRQKLVGSPVQLKSALPLGQAGDRFERQADRIADRVVRGESGLDERPQAYRQQAGATPLAPSTGTLPASVLDGVSSAGNGLERTTRDFMEPRFGHSFERVRIHTDASAAQSAQALNARAYTTGRHIVFGAGRYAPQTPKGQRLLAHELTHTLQQSAAGSRSPVIQREPDGPDAQEEKPTGTGGEAAADRKDIVFVMDSTFTSAAQLFSPGAALFEVDSPEVMTKHLEDFGSPIGTLFVLAHSMSNAEIKFDSTGWISADDLAAKLKGRIDPTRAPKALDLRGCSIGMNPTGMDELRQAVGADSVIGATCFMNIYRTHSVQLDGTPITKKSQLKKAGYKAAFNLHFKELPKQFGDAKKCIVDPTQKGYFQAGGHLVSIYTTKTLGAAYSDTHSVCYKDLPTATLTPDQVAAGKGASSGDCQLLKVDIAATPPPPASPSTTGKGAEETEVIPSEPAPLEEDLEEEG